MAETSITVRLTRLLTKEDEPPMSWGHVEALVEGLAIDERPIYVSYAGGGFYRIHNGRHRFIAALIRGDETLKAILMELR